MYCKQERDETLIIIKSEWTAQLRDKNLLSAERRSCNSNFRLNVKVYIVMIRIVNCWLVVESTELLGIKWKYSPTKFITEWKIPEHLGTDSSLNTRYGDEKVSKRSRSKSKFSCKYTCRDRKPSRWRCRKIIEMFTGKQ